MNQELIYLNKVKDRVFFIYSHSQEAVNYNNVLISLYEKYFGISSESVTRAGRYWRSNKSPIKFIRDNNLAERNLKLFDINHNYWN